MQPKTDPNAPTSHLAGLAYLRKDPGFMRFLETVDDAVFVIQPHTTAILFANHKAVELCGRSSNDLRRLMLKDIIWLSPNEPGEKLGVIETGIVKKFKKAAVTTFNRTQITVDLKVTKADGNSKNIFVTAKVVEQVAEPKKAQIEVQAISILEEISNLIANPSESSRSQALSLCKQFLNADVAGWYLTGGDRHGATCEEFFDLPNSFPKWVELDEIQYIENTQLWHTGKQAKSYLEKCAINGDLVAMYGHPTRKNGQYTGLLIVGYRNASKIPSQAEIRLQTLVRYISAFDDIYTQVKRGQLGSEINTQNIAYVKKLMQGMIAGVIEIDHTNSVVSLNGAVEKMLGYASHNVFNANVSDVLVSQDYVLAGTLDQVQAGIVVDSEQDIRFTRRDGQQIPARLVAVPLTDSDDVYSGALIFLYDQSERKAFEDYQLHLSKRAQLGDTISEFAHEVRQPLNAIQMAIQLLADDIDPTDDDALETVAQAQEEIKRLESYVNDTLRVVKYKSDMQPTQTDLRKLMQKQADIWGQRLAHKRIEIETHILEDVPLVKVDPHQLEHAVSNLIHNAVKAMENNPNKKAEQRLRLALTTSTEKRLSEVELVRIDVGDTGPGITSEQQRKIFQRYVSDNKSGSGAGLGLSMVRRIVESHGGEIGVSSVAGIGTVFSIQFPVAINAEDTLVEAIIADAEAPADADTAVSNTTQYPVIIGESPSQNHLAH